VPERGFRVIDEIAVVVEARKALIPAHAVVALFSDTPSALMLLLVDPA
jgi:hypothetical protein